jgi:glucosamine--fructose-6-phosphate aminotransferase (isomerizing)
MAKKNGLKSIVVCNVDNSSMTRVADYAILTRAGIEKGVASTKAFSTQVVVLWMLALYFAKYKKSIDTQTLQNEIHALREVPSALLVTNSVHERTKRLSKRYLHGHGFFFIGRDVFFPLALEGALKLKEISYIHAEGYPAAEMKHGPIALIDENMPIVVIATNKGHYEKIVSNIEEIKARKGKIIGIVTKGDVSVRNLADHVIEVPETIESLTPLLTTIPLQLLSYYIAVLLDKNVDQPRNLAKSVTVE